MLILLSHDLSAMMDHMVAAGVLAASSICSCAVDAYS
jgi:hypothetical protein